MYSATFKRVLVPFESYNCYFFYYETTRNKNLFNKHKSLSTKCIKYWLFSDPQPPPSGGGEREEGVELTLNHPLAKFKKNVMPRKRLDAAMMYQMYPKTSTCNFGQIWVYLDVPN